MRRSFHWFSGKALRECRAPKILKTHTVRAPTVIHVDSRETALLMALVKLAKPCMQIIPTQLAEGDVVITSTGDRKIYIERKSLEDFYNSIRSSRLQDQLGRMFHSVAKLKQRAIVALVLEGIHLSGTPESVKNTYHSLVLRDKLAVLRTESVEETANLIFSISRDFSNFFDPPEQFTSLVHVQRHGRKTNGLNLAYVKLLMSIHGVSANRAHAIATTYPTMDRLVAALREEGGIFQLACLVSQSRQRSVGTSLGTAVAVKVAEAVLGPNHPEVSLVMLIKFLTLRTGVSSGEALRCAKKYESISNLMRSFLNGSGGECMHAKISEYLAEIVDDPATLLIGLQGVGKISNQTAERIAQHFVSVRNVHFVFSNSERDREAQIALIRSLDTSRSVGRRKFVSRKGAENVLNWLVSEGYVAPSFKTDN